MTEIYVNNVNVGRLEKIIKNTFFEYGSRRFVLKLHDGCRSFVRECSEKIDKVNLIIDWEDGTRMSAQAIILDSYLMENNLVNVGVTFTSGVTETNY